MEGWILLKYITCIYGTVRLVCAIKKRSSSVVCWHPCGPVCIVLVVLWDKGGCHRSATHCILRNEVHGLWPRNLTPSVRIHGNQGRPPCQLVSLYVGSNFSPFIVLGRIFLPELNNKVEESFYCFPFSFRPALTAVTILGPCGGRWGQRPNAKDGRASVGPGLSMENYCASPRVYNFKPLSIQDKWAPTCLNQC
jgi:hypothetical protein